MKRYKKRQRNKIFKIVSQQINRGDFTPLRPVHFRCIDNTIKWFFDNKYLSVFRPWWYEQDWSQMDLATEFKKHIQRTMVEFEQWSALNMEMYKRYLELNHRKERVA